MCIKKSSTKNTQLADVRVHTVSNLINSQNISRNHLEETTPISQTEASAPTLPTESNVFYATNQFPPNYDDIDNYLTISQCPGITTDNDYGALPRYSDVFRS